MSYSQKQGPGGNGGGGGGGGAGGGSSNQAPQHTQPTLAGIQQQMQNLVHGQNSLPQTSQAGLNAFLTQQHFEMLKQQQQQLLLSNPQLQQRFQQQIQQSKDRGEPLALTRTPAAAELLNKTYQQHHQQQSNGNNGPAPTLSPFQQQQMQAANLMQQIYAYQLQQLPQQQQQQQQQQHHQQSQQSHHQQQSAHQHQQKGHNQPSLSAAAGLQSNKQQHSQQIQQSQYAQKYLPTSAHSKSAPSSVGISSTPAALANQLKPPNLPPSTQITPIPSPKLSTANNNLQNKNSSSTSVKQIPPSISLHPAKQPVVSISNTPIAAHIHHHQNKVPLSIPSQYPNPVSKAPLVSAIPSPFPSHYQKISNQPHQSQQIQQQQQQSTQAAAILDQEHKQQTSAVSLTKQQPPQSSAVTVSSSSAAKTTSISHTPPKPASLPPLIPVPSKEGDDSPKASPSSAASVAPLPLAASVAPPPPPPPPPPATVTPAPLLLTETKSIATPPPTMTGVAKRTEVAGNQSESHLTIESNSVKSTEIVNTDNIDGSGDSIALPEPTKEADHQQETSIQVEVPEPQVLSTYNNPSEQNINDANSDKHETNSPSPIAADNYSDSSATTILVNKKSEENLNITTEEENVTYEMPAVENTKPNDSAANTSFNWDHRPTSKEESDQEKEETRSEKVRKSTDENVQVSEMNKADKLEAEKLPEKLEMKRPEPIKNQNTDRVENVEKLETSDKSEKCENNEKKTAEKHASKEKASMKSNQSEKPVVKGKIQRSSKTAAAAAISADASGETLKDKDSSVPSKAKVDEQKSSSVGKNEKAETKKVQSKTRQTLAVSSEATSLQRSPAASTPSDRKSKRHRLKTILYQSPLPELAFITKLSASEASNSPKPMSVEDKLIVFYKHEYMAVRNAEGGFFLCQTLQNVYRSSPRISIRWLSEDKKDNTVFIPDFYDHTDIECVLTTVDLKKLDKGQLRLPKSEKTRIESILKRAIDVEKGILPRPDVTEENPDGLDISLYKDESQIEKKSSTTGSAPGNSGKKRNSFRTSGSKRNRSKTKSPAKKKKLTLSGGKKRRSNKDGRSSESGEDDDDSEIDTDKEYKPSRKKSILSNTVQSTKPQRAQRSPLAKARAASPITPTSSRAKKSVPQKSETPVSTSSASSRNDRAAKRRALEDTNKISDTPAKKQTIATNSKSLKGTDKPSNNTATTTEERDNNESSKNVNKASTQGTATKKNRTTAITTSATTTTTSTSSDTRPTRSRK